MSIAETDTPTTAPTETLRRPWWRWLRLLVIVLTAQYTLVLLIGLSVVATVRSLLLPQILEHFEAIATALKRTPL